LQNRVSGIIDNFYSSWLYNSLLTHFSLAISPNQSRLKILSDKLRNINERVEEEKMTKRNVVYVRDGNGNSSKIDVSCPDYSKLKNLQEKVAQKAAAQDIQFKILKEQIDRLVEDLEEERRIREEFEQEIDSNIYPVLPIANIYRCQVQTDTQKTTQV